MTNVKMYDRDGRHVMGSSLTVCI